MATTDTDHFARLPLLNRPDAAGALANAGLAVALAGGANGLIAVTGWGADQAYDAVTLKPPGWVIGAIWMAIFPMWGLARWRSVTESPTAARRSIWPASLIGWSLAYPILTAAGDTLTSASLTFATLMLAIVAFARLWPVSHAAAAWIAPSLAWLAFASWLGFAAVAMRLS